MAAEIYRDSLSAWNGLREIGGLDLDYRDEDLVTYLKDQLDPSASDLETALSRTSTDQFLQALFQTIQPFVGMFRDVLTFFEQAGARYGQSQWKVRVGDDFLNLRHFEEFLERWNTITCEVEVPALDRANAFIFNTVRAKKGGHDYLTEGRSWDKPIITGVPDADVWLAEYFAGRYAQFPPSLSPDQLPHGLDDAARVVMAALSVIQLRGLTRDQMQSEHRARSYQSVEHDAFHPWTIAQSETDLWLSSHIMYLTNILGKSQEEKEAFGTELVSAYSKFPRRRFSAKVDVRDLERLLSLPAWRKRYELYGVWVATQIVGALDDHEIVFKHENSELKFAFAEAIIAQIETSRPRLGLFSERWSPLVNPVGKSRTDGVQPDFGIWTLGSDSPECILVIEVKHYKKPSRRNFSDALTDYARAHPKAKVVLVNYGPVGSVLASVPEPERRRCQLIGYFNHDDYKAQAEFRDLVRSCVGEPVVRVLNDGALSATEIIAVDTSLSMSSAIQSDSFLNFFDRHESKMVALIDERIRGFVPAEGLAQWFATNQLGASTSLSEPVSELLRMYEIVTLVTDQEGFYSLRASGNIDTFDHELLSAEIWLIQARRSA
jgi:hypothetical protein